ncbi:MotA/TolQ/ExbB proton channel family protein [Limisphaera sp. VF-2]|uniref:MotA/TolQ/ExbB proton channel family protein n=1 Tax=Limisphaera sp. VF-2 TaxID=3400418 RepID=UPI00176D8AB3|nr:MotA/TolQ/ExbB proton channel family protein [Limisphaera sp.]
MLPTILNQGGPVAILLLLLAVVALAVFMERALHLHRAQINVVEFLNGIRNVLRRANVMEAVAICDATPGPVPRVVKAAILAREQGRERVREAVQEAGAAEIPMLERRLHFLATLCQVTPLLGLLGTVLGFMDVFAELERQGLYAHVNQLSGGIWRAMISMGLGLGIGIPLYAGHNYLVSRVCALANDMERAAMEIVHIVADGNGAAQS